MKPITIPTIKAVTMIRARTMSLLNPIRSAIKVKKYAKALSRRKRGRVIIRATNGPIVGIAPIMPISPVNAWVRKPTRITTRAMIFLSNPSEALIMIKSPIISHMRMNFL